jgi:hypothetical protein
MMTDDQQISRVSKEKTKLPVHQDTRLLRDEELDAVGGGATAVEYAAATLKATYEG